MARINQLIEKINKGDNSTFKELYGTDKVVLRKTAHAYTSKLKF